jgi:hypothetical protein
MDKQYAQGASLAIILTAFVESTTDVGGHLAVEAGYALIMAMAGWVGVAVNGFTRQERIDNFLLACHFALVIDVAESDHGRFLWSAQDRFGVIDVGHVLDRATFILVPPSSGNHALRLVTTVS